MNRIINLSGLFIIRNTIFIKWNIHTKKIITCFLKFWCYNMGSLCIIYSKGN